MSAQTKTAVTTPDSSSGRAIAVTPSDAADFATQPSKYFFVGVGGDVAFHNSSGTAVTLKNCGSGSYHYVRTNRILATGTTATDIVAFL